MNQHRQRNFDAMRRSQDYLDSNAGGVEVLKECEGRKQLDDAVARISASSTQQGTAILQMDGLLSREKALVAELRYRHMQPIATFARARLQGVPEFAALTRSTLRLRTKPLVHAAQAMAAAALPHAEALAKGGFPDCIARLIAAADAVTAASEERANTLIGKVRATKEIGEQIQVGRAALAMLHAVVCNQFERDATFMTGWNAARRVGKKIGAVQGRTTAPSTPTTSTTPTTPTTPTASTAPTPPTPTTPTTPPEATTT